MIMKKIKEKKYRFRHTPSGYKKKITEKTFLLPNGESYTSFVDDQDHSVNIFAITEDEKVILVKQFRPGTEKVEYEFAGGMIDPGEKPAEAASRELLEETAHAGKMMYLGNRSYSPYSSGKRYIFAATKCKKAAKNLDLDPNEFLEVVYVDLPTLEKMLFECKIRNPDCAYMALHHMGYIKFNM